MNTEEYVLESKVEALENRVENESRNTLGYLLSLQNKLDELEKRVREVEIDLAHGQPAQQSVADFKRSHSLNALNQKPTPADLEDEIDKAARNYAQDAIGTLIYHPSKEGICIQAFKAGAKWAQSKPLPKQTL